MISIPEPEDHREDLEEVEGVQNFFNKKPWNAFDGNHDIAGAILEKGDLVVSLCVQASCVILVDLIKFNPAIEDYGLELAMIVTELVLNEAILKELQLIRLPL